MHLLGEMYTMEILKFEPTAPKARRKKARSNKPLLAIAGVASMAVLSSTLAANITLNSSAPVEFGQGVALTSSCDLNGGITVNPSATYVNTGAGEAGNFTFGAITFSGIDDLCLNKVFTVKAYGNTASTPVVLNTIAGTTYDYATFVFASSGAKSANVTMDSYSAPSGDNGSVKMNFSDTKSDPAQVYKITLESSAS